MFVAVCFVWLAINVSLATVFFKQDRLELAGRVLIRMGVWLVLMWWLNTGSRPARILTTCLSVVGSIVGFIYAASSHIDSPGFAIQAAMAIFALLTGAMLMLPTPVREYLEGRRVTGLTSDPER